MARVLVIRHGALGDFVLSFTPFAAIRAYHPADRITLLTTTAFAPLANMSPWFDEVRVDARPSWWDVSGLARLRRQLAGYDMVYDLQTSRRSTAYFRLAGRPPWSGIAAGAAYRHADSKRDAMHTIERQREQLRIAGIDQFPPPDLSFLVHAPAPATPAKFALLVPGAAPHRPAKRWPVERYGHLATRLQAEGMAPVVVGTAADAPLAAVIARECNQVIDLTGRTDLPALAALAGRAALAVGNDTGPMHLAAAMGAPCLTLFSGDSDPALTAPRTPEGRFVAVLRAADLAELSLDRVAAALPKAR